MNIMTFGKYTHYSMGTVTWPLRVSGTYIIAKNWMDTSFIGIIKRK